MPIPEQISEKIHRGAISEVGDSNVELKRNWDQEHGKRISSIANELADSEEGFLIIGVNDEGRLEANDQHWMRKEEQRLSSHVRQYLSPMHAVNIQGQESPKGECYIVISIENPGDVTYWNREAYKRIGTQTEMMTPDERLDLALCLPGQDFSRRPWSGSTSSSLVTLFAQKLLEKGSQHIPENLESITPAGILERIRCKEKMAARVLFGDVSVRIAYYDDSGDVIEQTSKNGAFNILTDEFVGEVQRWTKGKGTLLAGDSISVSKELPYPPKALRECLANAVAHALYEREDGDIIVNLFPDRIVVKNNCSLDVKVFSKEWFSNKSWSRNKFLMQLLREAGFTDELGSGKKRLFSQMLEAGKREPTIEYYEKGAFACWQTTLYNEENNQPYLKLLERFKEQMRSIDEARLATALTIWRYQKWSEILNKLDEHYQRLATQIVEGTDSPIAVYGDMILTKRWVGAALKGKASTAFSDHEEEVFQNILRHIAHSSGRNGRFNTQEAKSLIGLSNTPSESTQLSNLFRKWRKNGILADGTKRGEWVFVEPPTESLQAIFGIGEESSSS